MRGETTSRHETCQPVSFEPVKMGVFVLKIAVIPKWVMHYSDHTLQVKAKIYTSISFWMPFSNVLLWYTKA